MADYPRFLFAHNPKAEPDGEYILHTQKPRFLAKKLHNDPLREFDIVEQFDDINTFFNGDAMKLAGLLRRLTDWYVEYKKDA